ncbi:LacI family DNA-binding transcriptional regulator [Kribbella monticola]|uniref:LacI family DNA-binding transcriptional regulator n=1 Tax=Kribbella monticola TaxID=2185285 RepID=UPI000DD3E913|nr:LacI family DNA-binding transcriptional regulator [Kribbella monticola]
MSTKSADRKPTLEDVALVAGVSRATASRVINGSKKVNAQMIRDVQRAVKTTGYVPNTAARTLVNGKTGSIALVLSGSDGSAEQVFGDPFFGRVTGGVVKHLSNEGIHPSLVLADSDEARAKAISYVRRGGADGALLVSTHADDPLPGLFVDERLPAVLFARPGRPTPISFVDLDHDKGAALAAERLVARGCRNIATISGPPAVLAAQDREKGFRQAMAQHGRPYVPVAIGNFTRESGEVAMAELLRDHPSLDGVFVANDLMAEGALQVLRDHGRRVPDDVAVVGFDDSLPARQAEPGLTTIAQPLEEMAAEMARLLLARIADPTVQPTSVIFAPRLVIRESA